MCILSFLAVILAPPFAAPSRVTFDPFQGNRELTKEQSWNVSCRVLDAGTQRPLVGMRVALLLRKVPYLAMLGGEEHLTDTDGRVQATVEFRDTYIVAVREVALPNTRILERKAKVPTFGQAVRVVRVKGQAGDTTECSVTLGPAAIACLSVLDELGKPVEGAAVAAISDDAPHPVQLVDHARTDQRGIVEYLGLGEGSWRLLVCKRGVGVASAALPNMKWGEKRDLVVRLGPSGDLYVAVHGGAFEVPGDSNFILGMFEIIDAEGRFASAGPFPGSLWGYENLDEVPTLGTDRAFIYAGSYAPGRYRVVVRSPKLDSGSTAEFAGECLEATSEDVVVEAGKDTRVHVSLPGASAR